MRLLGPILCAMAIHPDAVDEFFSRPRRDSDRAKRFTSEALRAKLLSLDPPPDFIFEPRDYQKLCFLLALKHPGYFLHLDMGLGKTKIMLDLFAYRKKIGAAKKMLVVVPGAGNVDTWRTECEKHTPHLRAVGLNQSYGSEARRDALMDENLDVVSITLAGWRTLVATSRKGKFKIQETKERHLSGTFDTLVVDESSFVGGATSAYFIMLRRLAKRFPFTYCLSGTPTGVDPSALWPQFFLVDRGETLGTTLGMFQARFFVKKPNYFSGWDEPVFNEEMADELYALMRHSSIRFTASECLDLPDKIGGVDDPVVRSVVLPAETWERYASLIDELRAARGSFKTMDNAYVRARMVASGYLPVTGPEGGDSTIVFKENPKLDALVDLLRELGDRQVIVSHEFVKTGRIICERLKKEKITHAWYYSGTRQKTDVLRRFESGDVRVLVGNQAIAFGLNLQFVQSMIFYESFDDPQTRRQMEARIHRSGQSGTVFIWDLVVVASLEEQILESLKSGVRLIDAIVDGQCSV